MCSKIEGMESPEALPNIMKDLDTPNIILWFMGREGLKKNGFEFMCEELIDPIRKVNIQAKFWLYNLMPWEGYKKGNIETERKSVKIYEKIESLNKKDLNRLDTADFFAEINNGFPLGEVWEKRSFVWDRSRDFPNTGVTIGEAFGEIKSLEKYANCDVNQAYSAMQYSEGLFIASRLAKEDPNSEIIFLLPNDECFYYETESFLEDLSELLSDQKCPPVRFISFEYGDSIKARPYLGGPGIKSKAQIEEAVKKL